MVLLFLFTLVACSNLKDIEDNQAGLVKEYSTPSLNSEPTDSNNSGDSTDKHESIKLFPDKIITYSPDEIINFQFNSQKLSTTFVKDRFTPFGFYMPSNMEIYSQEDGDIWGYDHQRNYVLVGKYYNDVIKELEINNEKLIQYEEYVGTDESFGQYSDHFLLEHNDKKHIIMLRYDVNEKETALPLFLNFVKTIRLVEN